ncbi:WYL domain-containing protein [Priestia aryabhattai]|uniref:WYL domain-containing protein n=1 Tax=Priestia aryabhattai TaxID=412384 RepID=UPI00398ED04E
MLYQLRKAFREQKNMEIMYLDQHNNVTQRFIRILKLNDKTVKAYCYHKKSLRIFKIDNMLSGCIVSPYKRVKGA